MKIEGYAPRPHEAMDIRAAIVGPDYLATMQIPLAEGRDFTAADNDEGQRVAIVNRTLADRYSAASGGPRQARVGRGHWYTVVGVARDSDYDRLDEPPQPFLYLPMLQDYWPSAILEARVTGDPMTFAAAVAQAVHELHADMPLYDVAPLSRFTGAASAGQRIAGTFVGAFGLLALVLATIGIYGVVAYRTRQRHREIGVRMALGANRRDVLRLVLGQGLRLTLAGLGCGLLLALGAARLLRNQLFGVSPTDLPTFTAVALLLTAVALLACAIPAWLATRVDPFAALRHE